jgi:hypothetical protein
VSSPATRLTIGSNTRALLLAILKDNRFDRLKALSGVEGQR